MNSISDFSEDERDPNAQPQFLDNINNEPDDRIAALSGIFLKAVSAMDKILEKMDKHMYIRRDSDGVVERKNRDVGRFAVDLAMSLKCKAKFIARKWMTYLKDVNDLTINVKKEEPDDCLLMDENGVIAQGPSAQTTGTHEDTHGEHDTVSEIAERTVNTAQGSNSTALYNCHVCGKSFAKKSSLQACSNRHLGVTFNCNKCHRRFYNEEKMWEHKRVHRAGGFPCEHCPKVLFTSSAYSMHKWFHDEKQFNCDQCGKAFHLRGDLKKHEVEHTEINPEELICQFCSKSGYKNLQSLRSHESKHRRVKKEMSRD